MNKQNICKYSKKSVEIMKKYLGLHHSIAGW